ncbi:unnamed protein product (macronuclear) [Paramecium tetraurelia]|uniref:Uncharacterized protein n=1 Tax=Paramecium tetraurelia TaxID=5888 RepID=A0D4U4_PARTE|nr:uncharacterized protein GSPATT00013508001 [Paramecium tetraurelia]CAK78061.1 unnamed protein product [Paramecium tetraurelia]|eukprot:XP_001445458.1 hypothetical protein (macronuclear) [Paramecium tetraurelia strain d4-2]
MQILENSDSIVSDDQSLELDCRIIVPKFKQEEYDTFQTEIYSSVITRVMQMRSNSQEFKFKQPNQNSPQGSQNSIQKQIQCTLLNENEYSNKLSVKLHLQQEQAKKKGRISKQKDKAPQSPARSVEGIDHSQTPQKEDWNGIKMSTKQIQPQQKQPQIRQNKRQLSQTFKSCSVEVSPIKISRFSQRQIYVTQLVNTYQEPLQEKLSLVQLENNEKITKITYSPYTSKTRTVRNCIQNTQIKGILKSKSCNSEGGKRRKNTSQDSHNKKSKFFKKVTFNSGKLPKYESFQSRKEASSKQLIIIQ